MRLRIILIAIAAVAVPLTIALVLGLSGGSSGGKDVVAAFYPLAYAADELSPPDVEVRNLTPPGAEPHDLELSPQDVAAIHDASLVLLLGHGFQPQLERAAGSGQRVVRLLDAPGLDRHRNGDPHVWLDPVRYALIVRAIGRALDEPNAASAFVGRLRSLDGEYRRGLRSCLRHDIVTSHEAFAYLAERYGLRQVAIAGLSPEAEPTPRALKRVVELVRRTGATTVFFETLVSPKLARTVARETGARAAVLDPIEGLRSAAERRGASYFTVMRANLAALRKALACA